MSSQVSANIVVEFTTRVVYSEMWWQNVDRARYYYINDLLILNILPVRTSGFANARFVDLDFSQSDDDPTTEEILAAAESLSLLKPDRPESETSLDYRPIKKGDRPIVCLCGTVLTDWDQSQVLGYIVESYHDPKNRRSLAVQPLDCCWNREIYLFRFIGK